MNILINQIFENKEAAALPGLLESGGLPALVSGLSAVHRANLAAALRDRTGAPVFVICPDDTAAESFANDLRAMLGEGVNTLGMRDFTFYAAEAASGILELTRGNNNSKAFAQSTSVGLESVRAFDELKLRGN